MNNAPPSSQSPYRGRFAPSPTGPLHFGSLVAAVGSYLQARSANGAWLVRMEDLDTPRNAPGAADGILEDLERFGLHWDEAVVYQSRRLKAYAEALDALRRRALAYDCGCSRRDLEDGIYPGTCRRGVPRGREARSVRVLTHDTPVKVADRVQRMFAQNLKSAFGDFVVLRADGIFAYHLAVTVDDALQGVSEVVRGADLLDSTPRQVHLQDCLGLPTPAYAHLPVAVNGRGQKLSKQTYARPVGDRRPAEALLEVLEFLGQGPPPDLRGAAAAEVLAWGVANWRLDAVPRRDKIHYRNGPPLKV
jgi:glutamyl-Q tRNA(Asp) synthetase